MPDLSVSGEPLFARGMAFLDDRGAVVAQRDQGGDVWRVSTAPSKEGPWTVVAGRGAAVVVAGKGRWLGFLPSVGVFGPQGVIGASMAIGADIQACRGKAAPDGTVALIRDYQSGVGLELLALNGEIVTVPTAAPQGQVAVVDRTRALWFDWRTQQVETCGGLPRPLTLPGPVLWPSVLLINGAPWLLYHSTDANGLVLHPFDSLQGYALTKPPAYYPLGVVLSGTRVLVAWANNPADDAGRSVSLDIATQPRVHLAAAAPPVQPPAPPAPPPKEPHVTPNHLDDVEQLATEHPDLIKANTRDAAGQFTEFAAKRLATKYPAEKWGLLSKTPGENQYNGHAVDSVICGVTNQVIDLMSGGGDRSELRPDMTPEQRAVFDHDIKLHWNEVPKRDNNNWMDPGVSTSETPVPDPGTPPPPPPAPTVDLSAVLAAIAALKAGQEAQLEWMKNIDEQLDALRVKPAATQGPMYGTVAIPYLGSSRVDLVPGTRPQGK